MHGLVLHVVANTAFVIHMFVLNMSAFIIIGLVLNVEMQVLMLSTHAFQVSVAWHILASTRNEVLKKEGA